MGFYKVLPSSLRYHGQDALTYSSSDQLSIGSVVVVPLQKQEVPGIVVSKDTKPQFATRSIIRVVSPDPLPPALLDLLKWIRNYYPAPLGSINSQFLPSSLVQTPKKEPEPVKSRAKRPHPLPNLTTEQKTVLKTIAGQAKSGSSWLLHGETGSGKTRIYLELAKQTMSEGKSVLVLTPEIGLVPQLAEVFRGALEAPVSVFHSNLAPATRRDTWMGILQNKGPQVVIGPRSALFSPMKNIGLIVVDEAHEPSYKQEQAPHYHALRVAAKLAELHKAKLITGSATPGVGEYYFAIAKNIPILRMEKLAIDSPHPKPDIEVVNLRDRKTFTRHPYLSDALLKALQATLNSNEQALVFLNRRGSARLVLCQNCGWQATCPVCNLPLTYHHDSHLLRCHTCGYKQTTPTRCPSCNSTDILFKSAGTKAIAEALGSMFPKATIRRFDTDNSATEKLEKHYEAIVKGDVDILVGTQMLGKGLDLPNLSLIGVINADSSLQFPDFTAEERTYQLLYQIIGRIGRGHKPGHAVIQTFQPAGPSLQAAIKKDWGAFYEAEIEQRRKFGFPPFYHILRLSVARKTQKTAELAATDLRHKLGADHYKIQIVGPSPAFYEKSRGSFHWQLVIKAKDRAELLKIIASLPASCKYDIDPINLL